MFAFFKKHLLQNNSPKQIVLKNGFRLTISEFATRLFTFLISLWVARGLGVTQFGIYNFVMTYVTFFVLIVDFGLGNLTFRELSKNTDDLHKYFPHTLLLKSILSIIMLLVVCIVARLSSQSSPYLNLIIVFFVYSVTVNISDFVRVFFRPIERMQNEAILKVLGGVILLIVTLFFLRIKPDLIHIFYGFLTASIINLIIALYHVITHFKIKTYRIERKFLGHIAKMSIPFFLGGIFVYFYSDVNIVLLKFFKGTKEVGFFSAPYRLLSYMYLIFNIISLAMFKQLVDASKQHDRFKRILEKFAKYHFRLSMAFFLFMFFVSKYVILLLYGQQYLSTDILFKILSLIVVFKSFSYVYGVGLTALSKEYTRLWVQIGIAAINVGANMYLIPHFGSLGAAYSLIIAEICLCITYRFYVYKYIHKIPKT